MRNEMLYWYIMFCMNHLEREEIEWLHLPCTQYKDCMAEYIRRTTVMYIWLLKG